MKVLNIFTTSVFQIVSLLFLLGYLLGVLNMYFSDKNNYCEMTYMFEYPQFVHISLDDNLKYPQYGLYAYSEGRFTERARKMWFDGIPVLFLPGNSGSHMQARSLASVALRKALSKGYEYHFNFFSISFSEEYSGLYGGVLQSQTEFAAACVHKILSLYKSNKYTKSVPTSIIVIGHSMGGLVAKRLMAYPSTVNTTNLVITLAAPLEAPVINFDSTMNDFYLLMDMEWEYFINNNKDIRDRKVLISIGSGPRDVLLPAGLTSSNDSSINVLTTAIPSVWVSPDHVSMVWCKQLVLVINRYLFDIVNPKTDQISENRSILLSKARQYFQANRSMTLDPTISRAEVPMIADAFWYEDNRLSYQIARPSIDKTTYLMIRLVSFPQNRFVAIEAVNVDDKDWIFGCNAMFTHSTYRYCKQATSLSELSRWSGAATDFGRRKLATVHLHSLKQHYPDWTHVIVRVSPTKKPITLNVDISDHASRVITADLPSDLSLTRRTVVEETAGSALYYELVFPALLAVHQAYLLYVEPIGGCRATQYHVTAELHVPWAQGHDHYHYYTHLKRSPMKLRLFKSNPNMTLGLETTEYAKVILLLDPQCTYKISVSHSWYHRLAQLSRNYTPALVPYVAALALLAARAGLLGLRGRGACLSVHAALAGGGGAVGPHCAPVAAWAAAAVLTSIPFFSILFENASSRNLELQYFTRSLLVLPAYMTALGILNVSAAAAVLVMVFSSQLAHRLLFRIVWRGGSGLAEKLASGLQKVPLVVSAGLVCAAPLSCGAASLAAGAAFYAFMISKMYEEYLEDYFYKLMAKVGSKVCRIFKSKKNLKAESNTTLALQEKSSTGIVESCDVLDLSKNNVVNDKDISAEKDGSLETENDSKALIGKPVSGEVKDECRKRIGSKDQQEDTDIDEDLSNINFHMIMFLLWMTVTIVNIPPLLSWARNFKFSMVLKPDTSYHPGFVMSICSTIIWQREGPRKNLKYYEAVASLLFTMAVFIIVLGPLTLSVVNYGVTFMFLIITLQQIWDTEDEDASPVKVENPNETVSDIKSNENIKLNDKKDIKDEKSDTGETEHPRAEGSGSNEKSEVDCDVCSESRIYSAFRNLREKFSFNNDI